MFKAVIRVGFTVMFVCAQAPQSIAWAYLQALQHGRACKTARHGSRIRICLCCIHSRHIKLHKDSSVTTAGGVSARCATGSSDGVIDAARDDSGGFSRGQAQL